MSPWTSADLTQFREESLEASTVDAQLERFRRGFPQVDLFRACRIDDGLLHVQVGSKAEQGFLARFEEARARGRFSKFVPASGAATRMFRACQLGSERVELDLPGAMEKLSASDSAVDQELVQLREGLERFAFFPDLVETWKRGGGDPEDLPHSEKFREILRTLLDEKGLGYARLSKALIPFHRYDDGMRTPLDEHVAEGCAYAQDSAGVLRLHFTVSPHVRPQIEARLARAQDRLRARGIALQFVLSEQSAASSTVAVDENGTPRRNLSGRLVFRPGGHGALLENLERTEGDLVFVKNIDNVASERWTRGDFHTKKILGGLLATLTDDVSRWLAWLEETADTKKLDEVEALWSETFSRLPPPAWKAAAPDARRRFLIDALDRPIRVCTMVANQGEPGGGPFWVRHPDGSASIQIVELSQVDQTSTRNRAILAQATHFNPVDLALALRDSRGRAFDLGRFVDEETGLISEKHEASGSVRALELPGLWNGSMAGWNTVFVEAPIETFNPVKTVVDLLRPAHQ